MGYAAPIAQINVCNTSNLLRKPMFYPAAVSLPVWEHTDLFELVFDG